MYHQTIVEKSVSNNSDVASKISRAVAIADFFSWTFGSGQSRGWLFLSILYTGCAQSGYLEEQQSLRPPSEDQEPTVFNQYTRHPTTKSDISRHSN